MNAVLAEQESPEHVFVHKITPGHPLLVCSVLLGFIYTPERKL